MEIIIAAMVVLGVGLLFLLVQQIRNQNRSPGQRYSARSTRKVPSRVMTMLHGDRAAAERLYYQVINANPDKSDQWIWEKVIHDLERDRRF